LAPGDPPTVDGLSAALVRALADPAHLARLRVGAWRAAQRFTPERHAAALEAVLERAAAESPGHPAAGRAAEAI
jgi:hypothetical protein